MSFVCDCTRDRFERALLSLGREELESLLADQGQAETVCQFCGAKYLFSRQDVERLVEIAKQR